MMNISIIILNYETKEITSDCIESILKFSDSNVLEVIVVDNNSRGEDVSFLNKKFSGRIKIVPLDNNMGFGGGNNMGAKSAQGEILFFLNSDTLIEGNIFNELIDVFSKKEVGIVSPVLLTDKKVEQAFAHGNFPTITSLLFKRFSKDIEYYENLLEVDWVSGAALAIRKSVFEKIGGFDENFFMYFEDIDLCKRAKDLGYKTNIFKNISVVHLGGKSVGEYEKRKEMYYKSQDYFVKKNYGISAMIVVRILRLPYKIYRYLKNK